MELQDLDQAVIEKEIRQVESEIDFTRPLSEYAIAQQVAAHLHANGKKTEHVYTESLNAHGKVIQDSFESYLAAPHYSSSQLKAAFKSPFHLYYERESGWKDEIEKYKNRPHFRLGTFLHECILEPTKFSRVLVEPKVNLASTKGVEEMINFWRNQILKGWEDIEEARECIQTARNGAEAMGFDLEKMQGKRAFLDNLRNRSGYQSVKEDEFLIIDIVRRNYFAYGKRVLPRLMKHSKREVSVYCTDKSTGLPVRIRPDAMAFEENVGANAIISVKSTSKPDLQSFIRDMASKDYGLSEGMYQDVATRATGRDFNCTIMIMVQTVAPYAVAALVWSGESIEVGKYKYRQALNIAKECRDKDKYPGYEAFAESGHYGLIDFDLPAWYKQEVEPQTIE